MALLAGLDWRLNSAPFWESKVDMGDWFSLSLALFSLL